MVAPSFQSFKVISKEPFLKGEKYYITVEHPNTLRHRDVRWYSEKEYTKIYGKKTKQEETDKGFDGLKEARGFSNGPIIVVRGNTDEDETWLRKSPARWAVGLRWYFTSTDTLPEDAPTHFKYVVLSWDEFRKGDDRHMKSPEELEAILDKKLKTNNYIKLPCKGGVV